MSKLWGYSDLIFKNVLKLKPMQSVILVLRIGEQSRMESFIHSFSLLQATDRQRSARINPEQNCNISISFRKFFRTVEN